MEQESSLCGLCVPGGFFRLSGAEVGTGHGFSSDLCLDHLSGMAPAGVGIQQRCPRMCLAWSALAGGLELGWEWVRIVPEHTV